MRAQGLYSGVNSASEFSLGGVIRLKIAVIYASMSGNTEAIADIIVDELKEQQHEVTVKEIYDIDSASEFVSDDLTFIGMYTWGDGDYPDECLDMMNELEQLDLDQYPFAVFGSGDTAYPEFCGALDHLKELIEQQNGKVIGEPLKIDGSPDEDGEVEIKKFVSDILAKI